MWPLPEKSGSLSLDVVADAEGAAACFEKAIQRDLFYQDPEDIAIKVCTVADGSMLNFHLTFRDILTGLQRTGTRRVSQIRGRAVHIPVSSIGEASCW